MADSPYGASRGRGGGCAEQAESLTYNRVVVDQADIDRVFAALADATRRDIVTRVLSREASVSTLARQYDMSFAAVQKHVAVLEGAGLVVKRRNGREQLVRGNVSAIEEARRELDRFEDMRRERVERFGAVLHERDEKGRGE